MVLDERLNYPHTECMSAGYSRKPRPKAKHISITIINSDISNEILNKLFEGVRFDVNDKGCWIRGNDSTVYTTVKVGDKHMRAHRLSFKLFTGSALTKLGCHTCDVPACINPDHVIDKSTSWNHHDAVDKNRKSHFRYNDPNPNKIDYYKEQPSSYLEKI